MKAAARSLAAVVLVCMGLVFVPPSSAGAQAAPDGNCDIPAKPSEPHLVLVWSAAVAAECADEAAALGLTIPKFITRFAKFGPAMGIGAVVLALWEGGFGGTIETYADCMDDGAFPQSMCELMHQDSAPGSPAPSDSWVADYMLAAQVKAVFCGVYPGHSFCVGAGEPEQWTVPEGWRQPDYDGAGFSGELFGPWPTLAIVAVEVAAFSECPSVTFTVLGDCLLFGQWDYVGNGHEDNRVAALGVGPVTDTSISFRVYSNVGGTGRLSSVFTLPFVEGTETIHLALCLPTSICPDTGNGWLGVAGDAGDDGLAGFYQAGGSWQSQEQELYAEMFDLPLQGSVLGMVTDGTSRVRIWRGLDLPSYGEVRTYISDFPPNSDVGSEVEWEYPFPDPVAPPAEPAVPVPFPEPPASPVAPEAPEMPENDPVSEGTGDQGLFDQLSNRIGSFFDGLLDGVSGLFGWLGDMLAGLFEWLVEQLWEMVTWLFESLEQLLIWIGDLLEWLGEGLELIYDAVKDLGELMVGALVGLGGVIVDALDTLLDGLLDALGEIADVIDLVWEAIVGIPEFILDGLHGLFVPDSIAIDDMLLACETSFPCSWVQEVVDATGEFGGIVAGTGSCTAPSFDTGAGGVLSLPAPDGCAGGNGAQDGDAGDLFGYRVMLRAIFLVALIAGAMISVLQLTPWGFKAPIEPQQLTLFD